MAAEQRQNSSSVPMGPASYGPVHGGRAWAWGWEEGLVEEGQERDFYYLWNCFRNIISSDYWLQIFIRNQRVIGFYSAVKNILAGPGFVSPPIYSTVLSILP